VKEWVAISSLTNATLHLRIVFGEMWNALAIFLSPWSLARHRIIFFSDALYFLCFQSRENVFLQSRHLYLWAIQLVTQYLINLGDMQCQHSTSFQSLWWNIYMDNDIKPLYHHNDFCLKIIWKYKSDVFFCGRTAWFLSSKVYIIRVQSATDFYQSNFLLSQKS